VTHPADRPDGIAVMMLEALAGLAPLGFLRAEVVFEPGEGDAVIQHMGFAAPEGATKCRVLDAPSCRAMLELLGTDLRTVLGPTWDRRVALVREPDGFAFEVGGRVVFVPDEVANARVFVDDVCEQLMTAVPEAASRQAAFDATHAAIDGGWVLDFEAAVLRSGQGALPVALLGAYQDATPPPCHMWAWDDALDAPEPLVAPVLALRERVHGGHAFSRSRWVVLSRGLSHALAQLALIQVGGIGLVIWEHDGAGLFLAVLPAP
jgi:hypothetical protein